MAVEVSLPGLHTAQQKVERERKRFNVIACGRRWGKTKYLTRAMAVTMLKGQKYGYFAATYKLQTEVWDELHSRLNHVADCRKSESRIVFPNGGLIEFWTLTDPDAGRSRKYHRIGVDEGGLVKDLETKWYEAIRPTLTDFKGEADFAGTPKGRNFFHTGFVLGQDPLNEEWASWQMPTVTNPFIDPLEVEAARVGVNGSGGMPERAFQQEYLAVFLEDAGGVFRKVRLAVSDRKQDEPPQPGRSYQIGLDLARVEDFTVITVVDDLGRQVFFERINEISWERQLNAVEMAAKRYKAPIVMDSTGMGGDKIYEDLRKRDLRVVPYNFTNATKEALIDNLALKIERGDVSLMDLPVQTDELLAFEYSLTPSRNVVMSAPEGMHDDTVIALALACWNNSPAKPGIKRKSGSFI
jgi:hypothetical protein